MKNGILNQDELRALGRMWEKLNDLLAKIPREGMTDQEKETADKLATARNAAGDLIRWQDHALWMRLRPEPATPAA